MSNTPLLESEHYTVSRGWHDQWSTYQEIEGSFQDWHITRRMEWEKADGKLRRDYLKIWKTDQEWYSVDVDDHTEGGFSEPVTSYQLRFSGHGALDLPTAAIKLDGFNIAMVIAKELERRLAADELKAPKLSENQDNWTDLLTGKEHQRGGSKQS